LVILKIFIIWFIIYFTVSFWKLLFQILSFWNFDFNFLWSQTFFIAQIFYFKNVRFIRLLNFFIFIMRRIFFRFELLLKFKAWNILLFYLNSLILFVCPNTLISFLQFILNLLFKFRAIFFVKNVFLSQIVYTISLIFLNRISIIGNILRNSWSILIFRYE
jgi:hypothetical protein